MARGDMLCPICGQILGLVTQAVRTGTDVTRDGVVGSHIHVVTSGDFTCSNTHRWQISGDLFLQRVS